MDQDAKALIDHGLVVLPAKGQSPRVTFKQYQEVRPVEMEYERWFRNSGPMWVLTGLISGVIVLDCDNDAAFDYWRETLGDLLDQTTAVKTNKGAHFWFRVPEGLTQARSWSMHHEDGLQFDVRGDGTGVMVPPSPHPKGGYYQWIRGLEHIVDAPPQLWDPTMRPSQYRTSEGTATVRSLLTELLQSPPAEGGRNIWLTQVAGHLAGMIRFQDAYEALLSWINTSIDDPLEEVEFRKTVESVWNTEVNKVDVDKRDLWDEKHGFIQAKDSKLYTMCRETEGDQTLYRAQPLTNFSIVTQGRIVSPDDAIRYRIDIEVAGKTITTTFDPARVTTASELRKFFNPFGCTFNNPNGDIYGRTPLHDRINAYIVGQDAPVVHEVPHLGWLPDHGYVTHDAILTSQGATPVLDAGIAPATYLKQWAPYHYGVGNPRTAVDLLRQVLTFHDEIVCAIFGAWWATLPLKAQITQHTALFPFMAIEAPSESGKTTGFFSLMVQLNGSTEGHGEFTTAALRDRASAHRNGIVWVDDVSDTYSVFEIIRQATSEGSRSKKGLDRSSQETVQMVSPIVITGEGLGALENEKALRDRAIQLLVGSPTSRRSSVDPSRSQWDDIVALKNRHPSLADFAGDLVVEILRREAMVQDLPRLRLGEGRHADKLAILRLGARILENILGDWDGVALVDAWAQGQADNYVRDDNYLLLRVIPAYLDEQTILPDSPIGGPAVFIENDLIWFSVERLASWWENRHGLNERERSLGAKGSLQQQCHKIADVKSSRRSILSKRPRGHADQQITYRCLPPDTSNSVMVRTGRGGDTQSVLHLEDAAQ